MRPDWMDRAACREYDPEMWFPVSAAGGGEARAVCASCPVRVECLAYAVATDSREGTWGGVAEAEREAARLRRPPTCPDCGGPRDPRYRRCPGCRVLDKRRRQAVYEQRIREAAS